MNDDLALANSQASAAMAERKRMERWFAEQSPDHPARSQAMYELEQTEHAALDQFVYIQGQQRTKGAFMAKTHTEQPIQIFKDGQLQPIEEKQELNPRRAEIIMYIERRLGLELAQVYHDAIAQSVDNGYYDAEYMSGRTARIEHYLAILRQDFMSKHSGQEALFVRVLAKLQYGTPDEQAQLRTLLSIEQEGI